MQPLPAGSLLVGAVIKSRLVIDPKARAQMARMDPARNARIFAKSALQAAFMIQANAANVQILKGGGGAKAKRKGLWKAPQKGPGAKLYSRTGRLRGDIAVDRGPLPRAVEIGSDLNYAARHEFGTKGMPKRAFMAVARVWKRETRL